MAALKTRPSRLSVKAFIDAVPVPDRRKDCRTVMRLMKAVTGESPKMWGKSIVGYGTYRYKYASGREGDWPLTGFSPRKQDLTLYIMAGCARFPALMKKLGPHKTVVSCLYVKRLSDVDLKVLERLIRESVKQTKRTYA
jgi:hypothetical protein